ncbi:MAG: YsnF/AvaK domain-containing protein [Chloroflexales bacterium]|nr:YsnF/AvaK domain-containing protein [Chloroflexales bacterium]
MSAAELAAYHTASDVITGERIVLPVVAEELQVGKRRVETGRVRLRTVVTERQETVDVPLEREEIETERVEINQFVDQAPTARREGDDLIIPLLEEVLVVEKRLRLKAEVRVRLRKTTLREPQQVTLRSEEIVVDRVAADSTDEAGADQ